MDYSNKSNEELLQLVNQKDGEAICELGERCLYGTKGHEKNLTKAYQMFHKAEKMGLEKGYLGLAYMYENGVYFAKNQKIADEYYQKAGGRQQRAINSSVKMEKEQIPTPKPAPIRTPVPPTTPHQDTEIPQKINRAEQARQQGNYTLAKTECHEVLKRLQDMENGFISASGTEDDVDEWRINTYWILAFTAFNEQNIPDLEEYMSKEGVLGLNPWGAYLIAVLHNNMSYSNIVLEQDLQTLLMVKNNMNMTTEQKGDVYAMIGDLISQGVGIGAGYQADDAYEYYREASNCGNEYAVEQMSSF